jgi:hypothetical protein
MVWAWIPFFFGAPVHAQSPATTEPLAHSFAVQSALCKAWYPVQLARAESVVTGRIWWRGRLDASVALGFGFTPDALLIDGEFLDDIPFQQPSENPHRPANWGLTYVADGMEFLLEDPTSSTRRIRFVVNTGSGAIQPRIDLLESDVAGTPRLLLQPTSAPFGAVPRAPVPRPCSDSDISFFDGIVPEDSDEPTTRFQIAIAAECLTDRSLLDSPWQVTIRLHDLDAETMRFKILEETVLTQAGTEPAAK